MHLCKRLLAKAIILSFAALVSSALSAQESHTYSLGVVPQFEPLELTRIWTPIIDELERRTGVQLELVGSPSIPEFETKFRNGDFDFAYMNPYHSIMADDAQGYTPIVRDGSRSLFGILAVHVDSPVLSVSDLNGARIAFPAPNALGASLMMRADLDRLHGITFTPIYASTHTSAYLNVVLGETEAAGGVMSTFKNTSPEIRDSLRILYETTHVAPHPLAAHPRVDAQVAALVQKGLIEIGATDQGRALMSRIPMHEPIATDRSDYQPLRDMELERYLVMAGQ